MSRGGEIALNFADGEHVFRLTIGGIRELQDKTDKGPQKLYNDIEGGLWRVDDVREVLRISLIGGGMKPLPALNLIERYVDAGNWIENSELARVILIASLVGTLDEEVAPKKAAGEVGTATSLSPTEN